MAASLARSSLLWHRKKEKHYKNGNKERIKEIINQLPKALNFMDRRRHKYQVT
jgi:hypothetical protein